MLGSLTRFPGKRAAAARGPGFPLRKGALPGQAAAGAGGAGQEQVVPGQAVPVAVAEPAGVVAGGYVNVRTVLPHGGYFGVEQARHNFCCVRSRA